MQQVEHIVVDTGVSEVEVVGSIVCNSWFSVAKPGRSEISGKDTQKHNGGSVANERSVRLVSETTPLSTVSKSCGLESELG